MYCHNQSFVKKKYWQQKFIKKLSLVKSHFLDKKNHNFNLEFIPLKMLEMNLLQI